MSGTAVHVARTGASLLETIVAASRRSAEVRAAAHPMETLEREIVRRPRGGEFISSLTNSPFPRIIAECKRRSPSRGILRPEYDPVSIAISYAASGAAAISVLTEPTFFDGARDHLRRVRDAVSVPLLRKDFLVTEYQLVEAAALGADAALLIVGALDDLELPRLIERCEELGLVPLVEVHDRDELRRALAAEARVIGVNSRNLHTLSVDADVLLRLAPDIPDEVVAIAESGLKTTAELSRLAEAGYDAFLVGERLVAAADPGAALRELRGT